MLVTSVKGVTLETDNIPQEFKDQKRWVLMRLEQKDDDKKQSKIPYYYYYSDSRKKRASTTNEGTWNSFEDVIKEYESNPNIDGIGFVTTNSDYITIDLDNCINGNETTNFADYFINTFKEYGYIEVSVSGKGIHIIVKATSTNLGSRFFKSEIYVNDSPRYITITGNTIFPSPDPLPTCDVFFPFYKRFNEMNNVLQRCMQLKVGKTGVRKYADIFESLFDGEIKGIIENEDQSKADLKLCTILAEATDGDEIEIDKLFRLSQLFRDKWDEVHSGDGSTYGEMTIAYAIESLPGKIKLNKIFKSSYRMNDVGSAKRLKDMHKNDIRYVAKEDNWYRWNGNFWDEDPGQYRHRLVVEMAENLYKEAAAVTKDAERAAIISYANKCESASTIRNILNCLRYEDGITMMPDCFDTDDFLFNCKNGTLDLRTMEFREARQEDLISKQADVVYDPSVTCPFWLKSLDMFMEGDQDLVEFLQRAVGYALSGDTSEKKVFILYGHEGDNGKSTFIETLGRMFNNYGATVPTDTLLVSRDSGIPTDVARLKGVRYAYTSEGENERKLAAAKLKALTGGDTIAARFLHKDFFQFKPKFKLFFSSNYKPAVKDNAIWNRLILIPFNKKIEGELRMSRSKVDALLDAEMSGIFNWAIDGYIKWSKMGLVLPQKIKEATRLYKTSMDKKGRFFDEYTDIDEGQKESTVGVQELFRAYTKYCQDINEVSGSMSEFEDDMIQRGFDMMKEDDRWIWKGLKLKNKNTINGEWLKHLN